MQLNIYCNAANIPTKDILEEVYEKTKRFTPIIIVPSGSDRFNEAHLRWSDRLSTGL